MGCNLNVLMFWSLVWNIISNMTTLWNVLVLVMMKGWGLHHVHVLNMPSSKEESKASVEGVAHEDHSSTFTCPILYLCVGFHYVAFILVYVGGLLIMKEHSLPSLKCRIWESFTTLFTSRLFSHLGGVCFPNAIISWFCSNSTWVVSWSRLHSVTISSNKSTLAPFFVIWCDSDTLLTMLFT